MIDAGELRGLAPGGVVHGYPSCLSVFLLKRQMSQTRYRKRRLPLGVNMDEIPYF